MKRYIEQSIQALGSVTDKIAEEFSSGIRIVKDYVGDLPIFVSTERANKYSTIYDEMHYFVIPYVISETGFTLHTTRCLPDSVPEINKLPKRRVFHFPNEHYEESLRYYLVQVARELSSERFSDSKSTLESLADDIDSLDKKLTYGMLVVGGVAAIFNPVVGAGIAVKALLPGLGGLFSKYGLRPIGQKMTRTQLENDARVAEEEVLKQFSESNTFKVVNPMLQELEFALRTKEAEHDPLVDFNLAGGSIPELDSERWRELTSKAVFHVYKDVYKDKRLHKSAGLGPEDIRWLEVLFSGIHS